MVWAMSAHVLALQQGLRIKQFLWENSVGRCSLMCYCRPLVQLWLWGAWPLSGGSELGVWFPFPCKLYSEGWF